MLRVHNLLKQSRVYLLLFTILLVADTTAEDVVVKLPGPNLSSGVSLEECLAQRRSVRSYSSEPLTLTEVSQLLWAAQGITREWGGRTAPSAGGLYPLEIYLIVGNVENLPAGIYHYAPQEQELTGLTTGDLRTDLAEASLGQRAISTGAIDIIITAIYERTTGKYGERGIQYVHQESGHAAQNICLQAVALDLGTVTMGAFREEEVARLLQLPPEATALYILPVGRLP